mgnify:CR=1 FL=1
MLDDDAKATSEAKDLAPIPTDDKSDADKEHDDTGGMSMSSFYSLDKPKDALSGTTQGVGNILKGRESAILLSLSSNSFSHIMCKYEKCMSTLCLNYHLSLHLCHCIHASIPNSS